MTYDSEPNPPYSMGDHTLRNPGITIEVLNIVSQKLGVKIKYVGLPWKRGLYSLKTNTVDGTINASFKEERLNTGVYPMSDGKIDTSKRNNSQSYSLFVLKNSDITWTGKELLGLKKGSVAATLGYSIIEDLQRIGVKQTVQTTGSESSLGMLVRRRVAAIADLDANIQKVLLKYPTEFQDVVKLIPPLKTKPYYLLLSRKFVEDKPELANQFWSEIENFRQSENFISIRNRYLVLQRSIELAKISGHSDRE